MSSTIDDQRTRIETALQQVRHVHRKGVLLADQLMEAAQRLRQTGRPLPAELQEELGRWEQSRVDVLKPLLDNDDSREFLPLQGLNADLSEWDHALQNGIEQCRRRADAEAADRRSKLDLLNNLLELKSTADSKYLAKVQDCTRELKAELEHPAHWRTALAATDHGVLQAFWDLVVDARDGKVDEPESLQRSQLVTERFGLFLTLQAYGGRIVPINEWPRTLTAMEAVSRLQIGQRVEVAPNRTEHISPRLVPPRADEFDRAQLESVGSRCHKRAESASRNSLPMEAMCLQTMSTGIEYVLEVLREIPRETPEWQVRMREGMQAMATSQSALRGIQLSKGISGDDADQNAVFQWLNRVAREQHLFIERHMRSEPPADPNQIAEIKVELDRQLHEVRKPKRIRKTLQRLEHKFAEVVTDETQNRARWERVINDIEHLIIDESLAPSHREIRELLLPFIDEVPEGLPESRSFRQVLAEADRYLADREADEAEAYEPQYSDEVRQVASILRGRHVVIIGGIPRPRTQQKIREAFGLSELTWERTNEHEATQRFEPIVQAGDVALVLILIRWVGHGHADDIKVYCQSVRRLYVFVPRGYGINQLAHDILSQRGHDLTQQLLP